MEKELAIEILEKELGCFSKSMAYCEFMDCSECKYYYVGSETYPNNLFIEAIKTAISSLKRELLLEDDFK